MLKNYLKRQQRKLSKRAKALSYDSLEPRQLLTTFYVDASTGIDSNAGTEAAPLASYLPFVSAYGQSDSNIGRIELQPGDEVVFAAGTYDETFQLPGSDVNHGFRLRNVHGTETAPITLRSEDGAILRAEAENGSEVTKLELFDTSHFVIEGFEVTGMGTGIQITNSHDVLIEDNWIHDIEGQASSIIAGLAISGSADVEATANLIHDNYDRSTPAFNSYNVEFDENTGYVVFHNNYVFNTQDNINTGTGPGVKHDGEGLLEIHHNVIRNAANAGIALDTRLASVHHNLVLNSEAFWLVPNESISANEELHDIRVFNNTIIDQTAGDRVGGGLNFSARVQDSEGSIKFDDNIIVDLDQQGQGQGILNISPYGSNEEYDFWVGSGRIQSDGNVYFNPNHTPVFDVYSAQSRGDLGSQLSFEQWQQLGFDPNGTVADPQLNQVFQPLNQNASNAGWYVDDLSRLTVLPPNDLSALLEGQEIVLEIVRSGKDVDLSNQVVVTLQTSNDSLLELPETVTFEAGQSTARFTVRANQVIPPDQVQAVRVWGESAEIENSLATWLRLEDNPDASPVARSIIVQQSSGDTVVSESGEEASDEISIRLNAQPSSNVVLSITHSESDEVSLDRQQLVFTPANWNTPQQIVVSGISDGIVDGDQEIILEIQVVGAESDVQWRATETSFVTVRSIDVDTVTEKPQSYQNGILTLPGGEQETVTLDFEFTTRLAQYNNELGLIVLDTDGQVNGIAPSDPRFARTALQRENSVQTIFASGENQGAQTQVSLPGGSQLVFFLIQNATREKYLTFNANHIPARQPVVFFSAVEANLDNFDHVRTTFSDQRSAKFAWEDLIGGGDQSFTDAVIELNIGIPAPADTLEVPPVSPPAAPVNPLHNYSLSGDVDGDGQVTIRDVLHTFQVVRRGKQISGLFPDINNDDKIDFRDIHAVFDEFFKTFR